MSPDLAQVDTLRTTLEPLVRRLHLVIMGIKADASEATNVIRSERAKKDMEKGLKEANSLIVELSQSLGGQPIE